LVFFRGGFNVSSTHKSRVVYRALVVACCLVFGAGLLEWPYEYYLFSRLVACAACIAGVVLATREKRGDGWSIALCFLCLLYNPLLPVRLRSRVAWTFVNCITIAVLVANARGSTHSQRTK
jgi:hypothetical protein